MLPQSINIRFIANFQPRAHIKRNLCSSVEDLDLLSHSKPYHDDIYLLYSIGYRFTLPDG